MSENTTDTVASFVVPYVDAWNMGCSCGYLATGFQTQALAQAERDNHWQRCHASRDDDA